MNYGVCSPVGGYGNHLRWLLFLSKEFQHPSVPINKLKFIEWCVYPKTRTYSNWLQYEWRYRKKIDQVIKFSHNIEDIADVPNKILILTIRPKYACKTYVRFNPKLNGHTVKSFMRHVERDNISNTSFRQQGIQTIVFDANLFYNSVLDKQVYDDIISFMGIENVYDTANAVHELWYNLHNKAALEYTENK
jgi:hypothetical protein